MYVLILAGGQGTRLWPISRKNYPKQISELFSTDTMIERTWRRLRTAFPAENIFISTDKKSAGFIKKHLKGLVHDNLIIEPMQHGTAAAIGYGASYIYARHGNASLVVLSSDAHVENNREYTRTLRQIETVLNKRPEQTVLLGVKPAYAETGYGYIKLKTQNSKRKTQEDIFEVEKFVEKPGLVKARAYVKSGNYLWNPGIFGWNIKYLLELYKRYLPKTYHALQKNDFSKTDKISIDYGILEKEKNALLIPANFDWADVGHWRTVHEILRGSPDDNVVRGKHVTLDSSGNLIYSTSGRLIATVGLRDTVIVETADAILICPRDRSQDVKRLTEIMKKTKFKKHL